MKIEAEMTYKVKFAEDIFILKSLLDLRNIPYDANDLVRGPKGIGIRFKREPS